MGENEIKKTSRKLSMWKIILISIIFSTVITFGYFAIEGYCAKNGMRMPIQRDGYGGDCLVYNGIFWTVVVPEPLTTPDDPVVAGPDIVNFSWQMLIIVYVGLAFIAWAVLSAFNKKIKYVAITIGAAAAVFLAAIGIKKGVTAWKETPVELFAVRVYTTDFRPGQYMAVNYPSTASYFAKAGVEDKYGRIEYTTLNGRISPGELSKKQFKAIIQAAKNLKANSVKDNNKQFAYHIEVVYKQKDGGYGKVSAVGYGEYPEGWAEFVRLTNEICGYDYLSENPETAELTEEWFSENFGITEDDLPDGVTVEDFMKARKIRMESISGYYGVIDTANFDAAKELKYYTSGMEGN